MSLSMLFLMSECVSPVNTGGLADVAGALPAALRRVALGVSERDVLAPWTAQVADLGAMLTAARKDVIELLQPGLAERAGRPSQPSELLGGLTRGQEGCRGGFEAH